jgi:hypothetical protein
MQTTPPQLNAETRRFVKSMVDSYGRLLGEPLFENLDEDALIEQCWNADRVLVAHDGGADPVLVFGNAKALELWEMSWNDFVGTPSRKTAEAPRREEREAMLTAAAEQGYFRGYEGVRISAEGRRFKIENAIIWNVLNDQGETIGQAATFRDWTPLVDEVET